MCACTFNADFWLRYLGRAWVLQTVQIPFIFLFVACCWVVQDWLPGWCSSWLSSLISVSHWLGIDSFRFIWCMLRCESIRYFWKDLVSVFCWFLLTLYLLTDWISLTETYNPPHQSLTSSVITCRKNMFIPLLSYYNYMLSQCCCLISVLLSQLDLFYMSPCLCLNAYVIM